MRRDSGVAFSDLLASNFTQKTELKKNNGAV